MISFVKSKSPKNLCYPFTLGKWEGNHIKADMKGWDKFFHKLYSCDGGQATVRSKFKTWDSLWGTSCCTPRQAPQPKTWTLETQAPHTSVSGDLSVPRRPTELWWTKNYFKMVSRHGHYSSSLESLRLFMKDVK